MTDESLAALIDIASAARRAVQQPVTIERRRQIFDALTVLVHGIGSEQFVTANREGIVQLTRALGPTNENAPEPSSKAESGA